MNTTPDSELRGEPLLQRCRELALHYPEPGNGWRRLLEACVKEIETLWLMVRAQQIELQKTNKQCDSIGNLANNRAPLLAAAWTKPEAAERFFAKEGSGERWTAERERLFGLTQPTEEAVTKLFWEVVTEEETTT
jgi:hypothetical protein